MASSGNANNQADINHRVIWATMDAYQTRGMLKHEKKILRAQRKVISKCAKTEIENIEEGEKNTQKTKLQQQKNQADGLVKSLKEGLKELSPEDAGYALRHCVGVHKELQTKCPQVPTTDMGGYSNARAAQQRIVPALDDIRTFISDQQTLPEASRHIREQMPWGDFSQEAKNTVKNMCRVALDFNMLGGLKSLVGLVEDISWKDPDSGNTALHRAVRRRGRGADKIEVLLKGGADVNATNSEGKTALHIAARKGNAEAVELLLEGGADVTVESDQFNRIPLHEVLLADSPDMETLKRFLSRGADVNAQNSEGKTALHMAAREGNAKAMEWLLEAGADVNVEGGQFNLIPLHEVLLADSPDMETLKLLLSRGADVNKPLAQNTIVLRAIRRELADVAALLVKSGADLPIEKYEDIGNALSLFTRNSDKEALKVTISAAKDFNTLEASQKEHLFGALRDSISIDNGRTMLDALGGGLIAPLQGYRQSVFEDELEKFLTPGNCEPGRSIQSFICKGINHAYDKATQDLKVVQVDSEDEWEAIV